MIKTNEVLVNSLQDFKIIMHQLTVGESLELAHYERRNSKFATIKEFLKVASNLGDDELELIQFQDACSLVLYYRMSFWNEVKLAQEVDLKASNFIRAMQVANINYVDFDSDVGTLRCYTNPTLVKMIGAYNVCKRNNDLKNLKIYMIAGSSSAGVQTAVDIIKGEVLTSEILNKISVWDDNFSAYSQVSLSVDTSGKLLMMSDGEVGLYSLPFCELVEYDL